MYQIIIFKIYLIIYNLYIRYIFFNYIYTILKFERLINYFIIKNFYKKYYNKKKLNIFILNKIIDFLIN